MSPVEQIALTINIALRREAATLDYYRAGSVPDAFGTVPKEWTPDQINTFQDGFDARMSGNSHRRRMLKFMPADFRLIEYRQPPLKDQYDEWLARVICYAFSVPATPFVAQVNRATSETMRLQATQEGLVPLKAWVKSALDEVIQVCMDEPGLEFVWVGDDAVDPLQQAQTLQHSGVGGDQDPRGGASGAGAGREKGRRARWGSITTTMTSGAAVHGGGRRASARAAEPPQRPCPKGVQIAGPNTAVRDAGANGSVQSADVIPICFASGIAIATDQYGNKLSTCHYECFSGPQFHNDIQRGRRMSTNSGSLIGGASQMPEPGMNERAFANPYGFNSEDFAPLGALALSPEALVDAREFVGAFATLRADLTMDCRFRLVLRENDAPRVPITN